MELDVSHEAPAIHALFPHLLKTILKDSVEWWRKHVFCYILEHCEEETTSRMNYLEE